MVSSLVSEIVYKEIDRLSILKAFINYYPNTSILKKIKNLPPLVDYRSYKEMTSHTYKVSIRKVGHYVVLFRNMVLRLDPNDFSKALEDKNDLISLYLLTINSVEKIAEKLKAHTEDPEEMIRFFPFFLRVVKYLNPFSNQFLTLAVESVAKSALERNHFRTPISASDWSELIQMAPKTSYFYQVLKSSLVEIELPNVLGKYTPLPQTISYEEYIEIINLNKKVPPSQKREYCQLLGQAKDRIEGKDFPKALYDQNYELALELIKKTPSQFNTPYIARVLLNHLNKEEIDFYKFFPFFLSVIKPVYVGAHKDLIDCVETISAIALQIEHLKMEISFKDWKNLIRFSRTALNFRTLLSSGLVDVQITDCQLEDQLQTVLKYIPYPPLYQYPHTFLAEAYANNHFEIFRNALQANDFKAIQQLVYLGFDLNAPDPGGTHLKDWAANIEILSFLRRQGLRVK